jgi:hypothetical protein
MKGNLKMRHYEASESVKYHGGYDPSDPPQGEHWCSECEEWDDDCVCFSDETPTHTDQKPEESDHLLGAPRAHVERMVEHANALAPKELADAITKAKQDHPEDFPS